MIAIFNPQSHWTYHQCLAYLITHSSWVKTCLDPLDHSFFFGWLPEFTLLLSLNFMGLSVFVLILLHLPDELDIKLLQASDLGYSLFFTYTHFCGDLINLCIKHIWMLIIPQLIFLGQINFTELQMYPSAFSVTNNLIFTCASFVTLITCVILNLCDSD